jgi:predicted nucleic-acid-binding protein
VKVAVDTNILVRILAADDAVQLAAALRLLTAAELIALPTVALAETVWVLRSRFKWRGTEVAAALQQREPRLNPRPLGLHARIIQKEAQRGGYFCAAPLKTAA